MSSHERMFKLAGFNGCIGSTDTTQVGMLNCYAWAHIIHKGFKLNILSRTYNMTINHCHQILGSTLGHPATWNNKTLILFDELVSNVNDVIIPNDYEFILYEHDKDGNIVEVGYKGVWFIVDNGDLSWSCTVPSVKDGLMYAIIRFFDWLESMCKDIECTFGILKGQFTVSRYGFRFGRIEQCDQM